MGRYINAEELKHLLNKSCYYDTSEGFAFSDMIYECKTADVKEVKHGKWIKERLLAKKNVATVINHRKCYLVCYLIIVLGVGQEWIYKGKKNKKEAIK